MKYEDDIACISVIISIKIPKSQNCWIKKYAYIIFPYVLRNSSIYISSMNDVRVRKGKARVQMSNSTVINVSSFVIVPIYFFFFFFQCFNSTPFLFPTFKSCNYSIANENCCITFCRECNFSNKDIVIYCCLFLLNCIACFGACAL